MLIIILFKENIQTYSQAYKNIISDYDRKEKIISSGVDLSYDIPDNLKLNDDNELNTLVSDMNDVKKLLDFDKDTNDEY